MELKKQILRLKTVSLNGHINPALGPYITQLW